MPLKPFPPRVLLRSEQSGGQVAVIDLAAPAGFAGPPLHVHDFDETFYILEGEVTFQRSSDQEWAIDERRDPAGAPGSTSA